MTKLFPLVYIFLLSSVLYSCSGEPFHLRGQNDNDLSHLKEVVYITGINRTSPLGLVLRDALKSLGASITYNKKQASVQLNIQQLNEGKTAAGYSRARKVREYDIFLKLDYAFTRLNHGGSETIITKGKVNVMRTQLYDSDFALAKAEEEETIRQELRANAAHLMFTKLHYSNKK